MLYTIGRENNTLRQEINKIREENGEKILQETVPLDQSMAEEMENIMENYDEDDVIQEQEEDFSKKEQKTKDEMKEMDRYIMEKQQFL